ncbi:unnamed protein product [Caenorhabditis auriculariae]|uniref:Uncharacterized protein n=1 Tax=Caenorhabditis auriculariae TaxID=2777116 RepID=A0A8S1H918_9PELO|nr:unnamed protein product [Caenorhabditis auriculariae]
MHVVKRRVLQMDDEQLRAVAAVVVPGRRTQTLRRDEMQEMCMKWLFANGLSMNHSFDLQYVDGEVFVVMSSKKACSCCPKASDEANLRDFDRSPMGESLLTATTQKARRENGKYAQNVEGPSSTRTTRLKMDPDAPKVHQPSSHAPSPTNKVQPVKEPKPLETFEIDAPAPKKESGWTAAKRECGYCCMSLCSNI